MISQGEEDDEGPKDALECRRRPLYTVRQPPLIQPLRLSAFTQKTCSHFGIPPDDLAHEWVVLFQAISGEGMSLQIPDTVLLSPSGQPSVWYTTSSTGRVKAKDLMRVAPQAIFEAFQAPLARQSSPASSNKIVAVRRLGFEVDALSSQRLKAFCRDMEYPDILLPLEPPSGSLGSSSVRPGLNKGVFCLQRQISCQNNASFLIVWRHSPTLPSSTDRVDHPVPGSHVRSPRQSKDVNIRRSPRAHSEVFYLPQTEAEYGAADCIDDCAVMREETKATRPLLQGRLVYLDVDFPESPTWKTLRKGGFDPDVMAPLLFYMKRVTSEIANCINLGRDTQQACGLTCEFFVSEHNRSVYFSALRGIQWVASAPSWELLRDIDPLSRSLCEFFESTDTSSFLRGGSTCSSTRQGTSSPQMPRSPIASDRSMYYEQNPRFPSVHTPFAGEKQWLHRSQLLAPDISPRYIGASVPKIYRDGVFQSLLTVHQADSVVRLNLSPQAPSSLAEIRRQRPHRSPRSVSLRRTTAKSISITTSESVEAPSVS